MSITDTKPIEPKVYEDMGLNEAEYNAIVSALGRHPTYTEVGMYSVMWSEHCGYKYSRPILRLFKKYREAIDGAGLENAGIIDIGDGLGVAMKIESHNHPSAVEPFQSSATGVGGMLRDIFTMGARPIACLNSLRFGPLSDARNRYLFEQAVAGIGFYGNAVGVPTVAGEVYFEDCYSGNCLVNAMALGVIRHDSIAYARADGPGNPVLIVGSHTGRDGIHGATFASVELSEKSESKKSNVQMGDPFAENVLIEATLEALASGYVVGIQDMGAAGITCSTCETSAKAGTGMRIDVRKVPTRETGMTAYEIMLSESQERMLAIVQKGKEAEVIGIFEKWEVPVAVIGEVTGDGLVHVYDGDELVAQVPSKSLADEAPTYYLDAQEPGYLAELHNFDFSGLAEPDDYNDALMKILSTPSVASKQWVYEQFDHMGLANTVVLPGSDAGVLRIRGMKKGIAVVTDCNGRYCYLDPFVGAQIAVAEAARNLACTGAKAVGTTDCLNFGNPEKPEAFWQFKRAVEGLAEACDFFDAPIVSGNVSLYNETPEMAIYPTPTIGMLGVVDDVEKTCSAEFKAAGDIVVLLSGVRFDEGESLPVCERESLGGSEYLKTIHGVVAGKPPVLDLDREKRICEVLIKGIGQGIIKSAHDCSDGGLAVTLAECCIAGGMGAEIGLSANCGPSAALFAETQSRAVVTVAAENLGRLREIVDNCRVESTILGKTGGEVMRITVNDVELINVGVSELDSCWRNAIPSIMAETGD